MDIKDNWALLDLCYAGEVDITSVLSRSRKRELVVVRQVFMIFLRHHRQMTLTGIAKLLGRDHTTVIHAIAMEDLLFNENPKLKEAYESACLRY
jgi:chromosomal replication initiator protein